MDPFSFATLANLQELEALYQKYQQDPHSVDPSFAFFFQGMELGQLGNGSCSTTHYSDDLRIHLLCEAYRKYGHLKAAFNPIATHLPQKIAPLDLQQLHFQLDEKKKLFPTCGFLKKTQASLEEIVEALEKIYCNTIGFEYKELSNVELETFIQSTIESEFGILSSQAKIAILHHLIKAELFENFLHTQYVGQKRFSLEGGETLIPLLISVISHAQNQGISEIVLGMAHRGRLNVLANILNKSYEEIFSEFEGHYTPDDLEGTGDVKYHKGFEGHLETEKGTIKVILAANPSHLESVDPIVLGLARARQDLLKSKKILPLLIHGDASLSGQGIVYETLQMCDLAGYSTGGTIHIVVNNQIGFTTLPKDGRSTLYCTEIARAFNAPAFHVNAEDPIGCVAVGALAVQIRERFGCDVFIDLNSYRKYGHNEGDEPFFTQPLEYTLIQRKKTIKDLYVQKLLQEHVLTQEEVIQIEQTFKETLKAAQEKKVAPAAKTNTAHSYLPLSSVRPQLSQEKIHRLAEEMTRIPPDMKIHPKIEKLLKTRKEMFQQEEHTFCIDWGSSEMMAYAYLISENIPVRISGEDVRRGTFSHRHAVVVDQIKGDRYAPLSHLSQGALFEIYNSPLSEFGVLGFEFGYSTQNPGLTIWEAQYGDFANEAQTIIDQYIAAGEQKWDMQSNLTLFLPHGFEGQGPEHSSARVERFLQLASQNNLRILNVTTPAQLFTMLVAQGTLLDKRPLILFSPKAILRHKECVSSSYELMHGHFQEVLEEKNEETSSHTLIFCTGKIYYDLVEERRKRHLQGYALIRIEQLYPFPKEALEKVIQRYASVQRLLFVQEEPSNMGALTYLQPYFSALLGKEVHYLGREAAASPATGSFALHQKQYATLMEKVFYAH